MQTKIYWHYFLGSIEIWLIVKSIKIVIRLAIKDINIIKMVFSIKYLLTVNKCKDSVEFTYVFTIDTKYVFRFVHRCYDVLLPTCTVQSNVYHKVCFWSFTSRLTPTKRKLHVSVITVWMLSARILCFSLIGNSSFFFFFFL